MKSKSGDENVDDLEVGMKVTPIAYGLPWANLHLSRLFLLRLRAFEYLN